MTRRTRTLSITLDDYRHARLRREEFHEAAEALANQVEESGWHLGSPQIERFMETWHKFAAALKALEPRGGAR